MLPIFEKQNPTLLQGQGCRSSQQPSIKFQQLSPGQSRWGRVALAGPSPAVYLSGLLLKPSILVTDHADCLLPPPLGPSSGISVHGPAEPRCCSAAPPWLPAPAPTRTQARVLPRVPASAGSHPPTNSIGSDGGHHILAHQACAEEVSWDHILLIFCLCGEDRERDRWIDRQTDGHVSVCPGQDGEVTNPDIRGGEGLESHQEGAPRVLLKEK